MKSSKKAGKELSDKIMPIGAKMYEAAQKEEKPAEGPDSGETSSKSKKKSDKDDPIEGEVVDDQKEK
jgi:molecular chaperone DnaK